MPFAKIEDAVAAMADQLQGEGYDTIHEEATPEPPAIAPDHSSCSPWRACTASEKGSQGRSETVVYLWR